jgi:hypothetical protein
METAYHSGQHDDLVARVVDDEGRYHEGQRIGTGNGDSHPRVSHGSRV